MGTHSEMVSAAGLGAGAADSWTAVGTVTLDPDKGVVCAAVVNGTANASTAAEAYIPQFQFDFARIGFSPLLVTGAGGVGEGIATQSGGFGGIARLIPLNLPFKGNEGIPITAGHHVPAPTAGLNAQAQLLYYEQSDVPPQEWFNYFPQIMPCQGADTEANATVTAAATAITNLVIPAWANHICGFGCTAAQDAAGRTAEDLIVGIDFTSTIKDFGPQEYTFVHKYPNLAGTLVGKGIQLPYMAIPAWIPTHGVDSTVTPTTRLCTAVTDAHSIAVDVYYTSL